MKKQNKIFNVIFFLILVMLIFLIINKIAKLETKTSRWYQFKQIQENTIDIVFLGNSHNMQGVIPQIVEDELGMKGFTLGVPGESIQTTYYELIELFKTQSPKYIGLETYVLDLNVIENDGHVFAFIDNIPLSINSIKATFKIYKLNDIYNYFSFIRQHSFFWKAPEKIFYINYTYGKKANLKNPELSFYLENDGYYLNDTQIKDEKIDLIIEKDNDDSIIQMNLETKEYLEKIITICKQNNVELFLFTMPVVADYLGKEYSTLEYQKIAYTYSLPYIDIREYNFSKIHFSDTNHLTQLGALRATINIVDEIANIYNLEINQTSKEAFQQLNVDNYTLDMLTTNSARFVLHSHNGDLEKNKYTFIVNYNDNKKTGIDDLVSKAATILEYDSPDEYRLKIIIKNPQNEYQINQNIILDLKKLE